MAIHFIPRADTTVSRNKKIAEIEKTEEIISVAVTQMNTLVVVTRQLRAYN